MKNDHSPFVCLALDDASARLSQVGGKGASLARMAAAGLPVPPGFHITTAAYRRFVAENGLQRAILAAVAAATPISQPHSKRHRDRSEGFSRRVRCRMILPRRFARRMLNLAGVTCPSRCVPLPPLKTCLRCRLPVSRRRISTCTAKRWSSMPSNAAGLRSGPRGRLATAHAMTSHQRM